MSLTFFSKPYAEYPHLVMDFQIIIQVAKADLRPTTPATAPRGLKDLITAVSETCICGCYYKLIFYVVFAQSADKSAECGAIGVAVENIAKAS